MDKRYDMIGSMLRCFLYWIYSRRICRLVLAHGEDIYVAVPRSFISQRAMEDIMEAAKYGKDMWEGRICDP